MNAANSSLLGGGGVDGAIHRAGGPAILAACRRIRATRYPQGLPTGEAVITTGGKLAARHVIHTVGPVYGHHGGRDAALLAACYESSIALAARHGLATHRLPRHLDRRLRIPEGRGGAGSPWRGRTALRVHPSIREVRLVFFSAGDADIARRCEP